MVKTVAQGGPIGVVCATKTKKLFTLRKSLDGTYYAVRKKEPAFCFSGASVEAVSAMAYAALSFLETR